MTTPTDRKRALPGSLRKTHRGACAALALLLMAAAALGCQAPPGPGAPAATSAPSTAQTPAPSPEGTAVTSAATGAGAPAALPPAAEAPPAAAPAQGQVPAPSSAESATRASREPVMEWHEGGTQPAEDESDVAGKHVFTNADLARFAKPEDAVHNDQSAADRKAQEAFDKAAAKKIQEQPATDAWKTKTRADAEQRVRDAEARLDALRRLSLSEANPLLPQPILSPEEQQRREGLSAEQRYKLTQQQIQQAEKEVADAKANLATVLKNLASPR